MTWPKPWLLTVLLCCAFSTPSARAQQKTAPETTSRLAPVEWFIGAPWYSEVKDPQSGKVIHVENTIEWAPNHASIRFLTKFEGEAHYNGFYAYNGATQRIEFFYTSSSGELTTGYAQPDSDGKTLRQEFDIAHPNGKVEHVKSTIERDGTDAYWFTVFLQKNGQWSPEFKIRYARKGADQ